MHQWWFGLKFDRIEHTSIHTKFGEICRWWEHEKATHFSCGLCCLDCVHWRKCFMVIPPTYYKYSPESHASQYWPNFRLRAHMGVFNIGWMASVSPRHFKRLQEASREANLQPSTSTSHLWRIDHPPWGKPTQVTESGSAEATAVAKELQDPGHPMGKWGRI